MIAARARITQVLGCEPGRMRPIGRGNDTEIVAVTFADGRTLVAKVGHAGSRLDLEGLMLRYLAQYSTLPVPEVFHAEAGLLLMSLIEGGGDLGISAQRHAADLLAALHSVEAPRYGFVCDTLIGPLPQPNPESDDWIAFFRDHRLLHMARAALAEGRLDRALMTRIELLAARLPDLIGTPAHPALIHGDVWGGNVLALSGRIAGFIDPAIYHADPEIELAFVTLFGTFGAEFFDRYQEQRPLRPGFFELRRDI